MKKIDSEGLLLCRMQAKLFEKSLERTKTSSLVFIRRFMNSTIAEEFDSKNVLIDTKGIETMIDDINIEFGDSNYGSTKLNSEVLYWIGYIYRYFSITYELTSKQVYKIVKPNELNEKYYTYHTFDPLFAIERLLEEKNISFDNSSDRFLSLLREMKYENGITIEKVEDTSDDCFKKHPSVEKNDCKNIFLSIIYQDIIIGLITISKNKKDYNELSLVVDDKYNNKEMIYTIIKEATLYAKENLKIKKIRIKITNELNYFTLKFEKNGFKRIINNDNLIIFEKTM